MSTDKPLHVQVAEALGWTGIAHAPELRRLVFQRGAIEGSEVYVGRPPGELVIGYECPPVPHYDTDWSFTGPLIEKYGIGLALSNSMFSASVWIAFMDNPISLNEDSNEVTCCYRDDVDIEPHAAGPTPLLAVCHLILALAEAGKL